MSTTLLHKRSSTANSSPGLGDLQFGELALNTTDGKLFFKNNDGNQTSLVTLKEDTELNFLITTTNFNHSSSSSLHWVLRDLDSAIKTNLSSLDDVDIDINNLGVGDTIVWDGTKFIAVGGDSSGGVQLSNLSVEVVDTNNTATIDIANVTTLAFDSDSGFDVADLGSGRVKVQMNSTFKTWKSFGEPDLVATGLDTVEFVAGTGIDITLDPTASPYQQIIISNTGSGTGDSTTQGSLLGVIIDMSIDSDGDLLLSHVDTFTAGNAFINNDGEFVLSDGV